MDCYGAVIYGVLALILFSHSAFVRLCIYCNDIEKILSEFMTYAGVFSVLWLRQHQLKIKRLKRVTCHILTNFTKSKDLSE